MSAAHDRSGGTGSTGIPHEPALPAFTPVPRKNTVTHGWTPAKQAGFIAALGATGSVRMATEAVGMSHCGVYRLRHAPGAESFARAWDMAVGMGAARIRDVLFDHAIHGVPETIVHGKTRVERRRFNHRTMIWALQHHMPDQYPGGSTLARRAEANDAAPTPIDADAARAKLLKRLIEVRDERLRRRDAGGVDAGSGTDDAPAG